MAHVVVDGPFDMPWIRENFPKLVEERPEDGLLAPDNIAENYWQLHAQARSVDLRAGPVAVGRALVTGR